MFSHLETMIVKKNMEHEWLFRLIAKQLKLIILAFSEVIEGEKHQSTEPYQ